MITPDVQVPSFLSNPVDDLLLFIIGLTLRLFIKTDKVGVRIFLYVIPLILKYIKRYYNSGYMRDKLSHLEAEVAFLKKRLKHDKIEILG